MYEELFLKPMERMLFEKLQTDQKISLELIRSLYSSTKSSDGFIDKIIALEVGTYSEDRHWLMLKDEFIYKND